MDFEAAFEPDKWLEERARRVKTQGLKRAPTTMQPGVDPYRAAGQQYAQQAPQPVPVGYTGQPQVVMGAGQPQVMVAMGGAPATNATTGLVLGILALLTGWIYGIGCILNIIGLVLASGASKITKSFPGHPDTGTASAGLIVNWIAFVLNFLIIGLIVMTGVLYVWANSLASEEAESGTRNTYIADDADDAISSSDYDTLITMRWQHAEDDLNWAFVLLRLTVGDNTYECDIFGGDCMIGQDGHEDGMWETGESLTLSENDVDICGGQGQCYVNIYVTYRGSVVAGTSDLTVS
jgi:hypothetical protein